MFKQKTQKPAKNFQKKPTFQYKNKRFRYFQNIPKPKSLPSTKANKCPRPHLHKAPTTERG